MSFATYRPDIDGLRAIAVLAVVFYHYGIRDLRGGFIGVDVFFVISGYLITKIIDREMRRGTFTLADFYERRIRRIFPALFVMLLATMVVGAWLLLPTDLVRLGQASIATLLFASNLWYLLQSGYFEESSEFNALLHTWSLGVEEQFYFGLPLLMLLVRRYWPGKLLLVLGTGALASFAACILVQIGVPKAAFFLPPVRAWELLAGSILAVGIFPAIAGQAIREVLASAAIAVLFGSILFMSPSSDFPGWRAALPVVATAALLHTGASGGSWVNTILASRPLVLVGLISYSLYLWHWPALVFAKYRAGMEPLPPDVSLALLLVVACISVASYYWIERPFRRNRAPAMRSSRSVFAWSGASAAALLAASALLVTTGGLPARVPLPVQERDLARSPEIPFLGCDGTLPGESRSGCRIGAVRATTRALVWGDSHALAWLPGLERAFAGSGVSAEAAIMSACAPLLGVHNHGKTACKAHNDAVFDWIKGHRPDRIYLIAAWSAWSDVASYRLSDEQGRERAAEIFGPAYRRTLDALAPHTGQIIVIGPTPATVDFVPFRLALAEWKGFALPPNASRVVHSSSTRNFWKNADVKSENVLVVDPEPWFCGDAACRYSANGVLLYRDEHHLSVAGALFAATRLLAVQDQDYQRTSVTEGDE